MFSEGEFHDLYSELRKIAAIHLRRSVRTPSVQPTQLVHEAWLRLSGRPSWNGRTHFLALASRTMRMVLIDMARARMADKREGDRERVPWGPQSELADWDHNANLPLEHFIEIDRVLKELTERDARKGRIVEMRFFGGLKFHEIAEVLGISLATVRRDWEFARAWLFARLASADDHIPPPDSGSTTPA